jgi:hypothetical protein
LAKAGTSGEPIVIDALQAVKRPPLKNAAGGLKNA